MATTVTVKNYSGTSITINAGGTPYTIASGATQAGISLADLDNVVKQGQVAPHGAVNVVGAGAFACDYAILPITEAT
jgi:hypothetical protein